MEQQAINTGRLSLVQCGGQAGGGIGPIRACVTQALETYFRQLSGHECQDLYKLVLAEVEAPLLATVMRHCGGNQSKAAQVLGINRGTLRKKLQQYDLER